MVVNQKGLKALVVTTGRRIERSYAVRQKTSEILETSKQRLERSKVLLAQELPAMEAIAAELPAAAEKPARPGDLLEVVSGRSFVDEVVSMDGRHFVDCSLTRCTLQYAGQPMILESTSFEGCRFRFEDEAALTLNFLACFNLSLENKADCSVKSLSQRDTLRRQLPN